MIDMDNNSTFIILFDILPISVMHASYPRPQPKSLEACSLEQAFQ